MSAPAPATPSLPLDRLEEPETIDDVVRTIDHIIGWAIKAESPIGYFAVLYRRCTGWRSSTSPSAGATSTR
jgi:hypothetical protein